MFVFAKNVSIYVLCVFCVFMTLCLCCLSFVILITYDTFQ